MFDTDKGKKTMPIGFWMEDIDFSSDGLKDFPEHAAILGQIVTGFSLIEGTIGGIYGMLSHKKIEQGIETLQEIPSNAKRVDAVRKAIFANPLLSVDPSHDDLMKRVLRYAERRNKIAHGLWGSKTSEQNTIYRLPVKAWIVFNAGLINAGTSGTIINKIDQLKAHLESYDFESLASFKADGDNLLLDVLNLFNKLARGNAKDDGWLETDDT